MLFAIVPVQTLAKYGNSNSYFCDPYKNDISNVAIGTHGMNDGMVPVPDPFPSPNVSWHKGRGIWVYDDIYGSGQRPTTGIWATGENLSEFA